MQIDSNCNVCPKVVYEGEGGALVSTTPAQFEASVAQSSAKKWRHSFKAAGAGLRACDGQEGRIVAGRSKQVWESSACGRGS